ncbi:hypothetical protein MNBD_GAMMA21-677 [hydrothermal vent metagenome]|uniref:Uncharacterized protein n=1 Tax=hydrothermal vent metagenome TaxID=652676 RepID=A0A3B1ACJ0_9ZZZZ
MDSELKVLRMAKFAIWVLLVLGQCKVYNLAGMVVMPQFDVTLSNINAIMFYFI